MENIRFLYKPLEPVIKLFNVYSPFASKAKYKTICKKRIPNMSQRAACVVKISNHSNLKTLSPKQMLQRLPIALAQIKAGKTFEYLLNEIRQIIYSLYRVR